MCLISGDIENEKSRGSIFFSIECQLLMAWRVIVVVYFFVSDDIR
jgi:hypothetical protein